MLRVKSLSVCYPDKTKAVEDFSLTLQTGQSAGLAGSNGAGKTTLMLALAGVLPFTGVIEADGIILGKKTIGEVRSRVGLVFQNPDDQLFMPSLYDDIAFGPRNLGLPEAEVRERVDTVLQQLGIAHLRERSPLRLSGGEKRVAAIATVLAMRPSIMLFDEPTAFLDHKARRALIGLLRDLPHTKLIASHDLSFLLEVCDRAVLMKQGTLFAEGPAAELLRDGERMRGCDLEAI